MGPAAGRSMTRARRTARKHGGKHEEDETAHLGPTSDADEAAKSSRMATGGQARKTTRWERRQGRPSRGSATPELAP